MILEKLFKALEVVKILVHDGDYLLMGRKKYGIDKGKIVLPGGKVKEKELFHLAAARELFEETGLIAGRMELFHMGQMIENLLSVKFEIFFIKLSDCIGKVAEQKELADLTFYHKKYLPLDCVYLEFLHLHQDILDGNKYYFEVYRGKNTVSYNKRTLLLHKVLFKKQYPKNI